MQDLICSLFMAFRSTMMKVLWSLEACEYFVYLCVVWLSSSNVQMKNLKLLRFVFSCRRWSFEVAHDFSLS
jgi:uncharacterized membrane protein (GlpM family)